MTDNKKDTLSPVWGLLNLKDETTVFSEIGNLRLWICRSKSEIKIAHSYFDPLSETEDDGNALPEPQRWQRWAFKQSGPDVEILPVFPDRPVVIQAENPFRIAEDAAVRFFVRVPLWIKIKHTGKTETTLIELPAVNLSNTWFGDFQSGQLCYWISSGARRELEADPERPYLALCPLRLIDNSPEDLIVEKICLYVANLSLYYDGSQLWSDEMQVTYRGKSEVSQIDVTGKAPPEAKNAKMITSPRIKIKSAFSAKTLATFRELPGIGLFTR